MHGEHNFFFSKTSCSALLLFSLAELNSLFALFFALIAFVFSVDCKFSATSAASKSLSALLRIASLESTSLRAVFKAAVFILRSFFVVVL